MRPIYPSDLDLVTRTLLACEPPDRLRLARQIITRADIADRYRKNMGHLHPSFGSGTLSSAAQDFPARPANGYCNRDYLEAMSILLGRLLIRAGHQDR